MKVDNINADNILLDKKSYENVLVDNILYKKFMDTKPLRIKFNKVEGLIKIYNEIRYLELFNLYGAITARINFRYNAIFDKINYLISKKSGITESITHNFARIRIDSCNSLLIEKRTDFLWLL